MRCYDDMPYSEIAETMGSSEFSTRMLFMRAKRALQKELSKNGFGKGSFLAALVIFGKMTSPTKAAAAQVSVTAASVKVGVIAGTVGLATTKTAIISLAAAGVLATGTAVVKPELFNLAPKEPIAPTALVQSTNSSSQNNLAKEEYQWFFPQGPGEPVMMQARFGSLGDSSYRKVLQNQHGNYYYNGNSVNINNYHMYNEDLSVMQMPTDDPKMASFISQVEGTSKGIEHITAKGRGLLVIEPRNSDDGNKRPLPLQHTNVFDEDFFQSDWPITAEKVDNRDEMHKRGWTYFRIEGRINGQAVVGRGRIPFIYAESTAHSPWMSLTIGSSELLIDTGSEAYIYRPGNDRIDLYPGGSFFKGMARPWMGLNAIDMVRRDAAGQQIKFETKYVDNTDKKNAEVRLITNDVTLIYNIDLKTDVINEISFSTGMGVIGNLKFTYLQNIEGTDAEFAIPRRARLRTTSMESDGLLWLTKLVEETH